MNGMARAEEGPGGECSIAVSHGLPKRAEIKAAGALPKRQAAGPRRDKIRGEEKRVA
jgi:hypothetical protein